MTSELTGLWEKALSAEEIGFAIVKLDVFFGIFDQALAYADTDRIFLIKEDCQGTGCLMQVLEWQHADKTLRFHCHTSLPLREEFRQRQIPWSIWS